LTTSEPNEADTQKKRRALAVQVHEIQVEGINMESRMDGSSCESKYGLTKKIINEAVKIYPAIGGGS
jgi:hypothetical protein